MVHAIARVIPTLTYSRCVGKIICGASDRLSVCLLRSLCAYTLLFALYMEKGLSYQHQIWYPYRPILWQDLGML